MGAQVPHRLQDLLLVERTQHIAVAIHALVQLEAQVWTHQRGARRNREIEDVAPAPFAPPQGVPRAARADDAAFRDLALEYGIGRHRRPMHEHFRLTQQRASRNPNFGGGQRHAFEHADRKILRRGRGLVPAQQLAIA